MHLLLYCKKIQYCLWLAVKAPLSASCLRSEKKMEQSLPLCMRQSGVLRKLWGRAPRNAMCRCFAPDNCKYIEYPLSEATLNTYFSLAHSCCVLKVDKEKKCFKCKKEPVFVFLHYQCDLEITPSV